MMFLVMADQLNEYDGEFDNEEDMQHLEGQILDQDAAIRDKRIQNMKDAKQKQPQMNVSIDLKGTINIES